MTNSILAKMNTKGLFGLALGKDGTKANPWRASVCSTDGHWTVMCGGKTPEAAVAAALDRATATGFDFDTIEAAADAADDSFDFG